MDFILFNACVQVLLIESHFVLNVLYMLVIAAFMVLFIAFIFELIVVWI